MLMLKLFFIIEFSIFIYEPGPTWWVVPIWWLNVYRPLCLNLFSCESNTIMDLPNLVLGYWNVPGLPCLVILALFFGCDVYAMSERCPCGYWPGPGTSNLRLWP